MGVIGKVWQIVDFSTEDEREEKQTDITAKIDAADIIWAKKD